MEFIKITEDNLNKEHICCAIANEKDPQVISKKSWLRERLPEGLTFLKADVRGKCFIEYIPAEYAWVPVDADGYVYINCFWISGKYKGQGYANTLLAECIRESMAGGKKGVCVLSSEKKKPFLSDSRYLKYKGFKVADRAEPYFELLYYPFDENVPKPFFKPQAKKPHIDENGYVIYYTHQCPFTTKYVPLLGEAAKENEIPFRSVLIDSLEKAKAAPAAATGFALFHNGEFVTNEILSVKKFLTMVEEMEQGGAGNGI